MKNSSRSSKASSFVRTPSLRSFSRYGHMYWSKRPKPMCWPPADLITEDTIDENILSALERKDVTQQSLMNAVRARLKNSRVKEQNPQREHGGVMQ